MAEFNVLTATAEELAQKLTEGRLSSVVIVDTYLSHIESHNNAGARLHAIISMPSRDEILSVAHARDRERAERRLRGKLHGVPIIVKDAFNTARGLGMPTTVGSYALADSFADGNADVVEKLVQQGMIIMGKANLTEFCGFKGVGGWSAIGGMCQSPYIPGGIVAGEQRRGETAPGGSSTGSAVGVAAGFSPVSLGTETSGSLTSPASRAGLYALKLTPGTIGMEGVWGVSHSFDSVGAMAKTPRDLALVSDILCSDENKPSLVDALNDTCEAFSVGFVDMELWRLPSSARGFVPGYNEQSSKDYTDAIERLRDSGVRVVHPVFITPPEEWTVEGGTNVDDLMDDIMRSQARDGCNRYLESLPQTKVKTLQDIIAFNEANADKEFDEEFCPNQNGLLKARDLHMSKEATERNLDICHKWAAKEGVDKAQQEHGVSVIVAPADSFFAGVGVGARYPLASVPLSYVESSGRPYGLHVVARNGQEADIMKFMGLWERILPARRVPDLESLANHWRTKPER